MNGHLWACLGCLIGMIYGLLFSSIEAVCFWGFLVVCAQLGILGEGLASAIRDSGSQKISPSMGESD